MMIFKNRNEVYQYFMYKMLTQENISIFLHKLDSYKIESNSYNDTIYKNIISVLNDDNQPIDDDTLKLYNTRVELYNDGEISITFTINESYINILDIDELNIDYKVVMNITEYIAKLKYENRNRKLSILLK